MIANSANLKSLMRGWKATFQNALKSGQTPMWQTIAQMVPSTTSGEDYGWIDDSPKMRKWIGPRQITRLRAHKYSIENEDFELTVGVPKKDIQDDKLGVYTIRFGNMGTAVLLWPDDVVFELLEDGETTLCYDGQYFFDTDHPVGREDLGTNTTDSNLLNNGGANAAHPWYLFDTTKMVKPMIWQLRQNPEFVSRVALDSDNVFLEREYQFGVDARGNAGFGLWQCAQKNEGALDAAGVKASILAMNEIVNDEGRSMKINPNILMVPLYHQFTALEVIQPGNPSDADGVPNVFQNIQVVVNPMLT